MPVPGPPRGRRRRFDGGVLERVQAMRQGELDRPILAAALLRFARDVILLLKDLATDPRVPRRDKVLAGLAAAYLLSPVDLVPDQLPVLGQLDDAAVVAFALRRLLAGARYDVVYEHWRGTDEGLSLVLTLAGVQD